MTDKPGRNTNTNTPKPKDPPAPAVMVIKGEQPSMADLEKKPKRRKKQKNKATKPPLGDVGQKNKATKPPLGDDGKPMGVFEEVARVLKVYDGSDHQKQETPVSRRSRHRRNHRGRRSTPAKSSLKQTSKDWVSPSTTISTTTSTNQFFQEEDQFDGMVHRSVAVSGTPLDHLELRSRMSLDQLQLETQSQATKGSRFSSLTFLGDNTTVREILNTLFDKEKRQSTSQNFRQRFSMKALEQEELPSGSGERSLAGTDSVDTQSIPALGNNWDAGSTRSWLQRSVMGSVTPFRRPTSFSQSQESGSSTREQEDASIETSPIQKIQRSNRDQPRELPLSPNSNLNHSRQERRSSISQVFSTRRPSLGESPPLPNSNLNHSPQERRSSISQVFSTRRMSLGLSFSNLQEESIETAKPGARRGSFFGIRLGSEDVKEQDHRGESKGKPVIDSTRAPIADVTASYLRQASPKKEEKHVPVEQMTRLRGRSDTANTDPRNSEEATADDDDDDDDDDDHFIDQYIEDLVAKERSDQEEESIGKLVVRDLSRGEESLQDVDSSNADQEELSGHDDNPAMALNDHLEALKDGLDKIPRKKNLGSWFDRNLDRTKILSSVEDRSNYGDLDSIEGYSLQESRGSVRRSGRGRNRPIKRDNDLDSVIEAEHFEDEEADNYSDFSSDRERSDQEYSDRDRYSDRERSDREYSDHDDRRHNNEEYARRRSYSDDHSDIGSSDGSREYAKRRAYSDDYSDYSGRDDEYSDRRDRDEEGRNGDLSDGDLSDDESYDRRSDNNPKYTKEPFNSTTKTEDLTDESRLPDGGVAIKASSTKAKQYEGSHQHQDNPAAEEDQEAKESETKIQAIGCEEGTNNEPQVDFDPENFQPREIETIEEKPLELLLDATGGDGEEYKDFPRHDGTAFFRYRLQDWKESVNDTKTGRVVTFDKVIIREHNLCPGVNPSCSDSLPISLDWDHGAVRVWAIDDFEKVKYMFPVPEDAEGMARRLSWMERRELLKDVGGYSDIDIRKSELAFSKVLERDRKYLEGKNRKCPEGKKQGGLFSRLFSAPSGSSSSAAPPEDQEDAGLTEQKVAPPDNLIAEAQEAGEEPTAKVVRV